MSATDVLEMQRRFECGTCSKNYKYKRDLTRHLRYECLAERQFACSLCQYRGKRKAHLIQHSMLMHNNQLESARNASSAEARRTFPLQQLQQELQVQARSGASSALGVQPPVRLSLVLFQNLIPHEPQHPLLPQAQHTVDLTRAETGLESTRLNIPIQLIMLADMNKLMCKNCGKVYKYQRGLTRHERYECGDKKLFQCSFCDYKAKQKETLKMHVFSKHKMYMNSSHNLDWSESALKPFSGVYLTHPSRAPAAPATVHGQLPATVSYLSIVAIFSRTVVSWFEHIPRSVRGRGMGAHSCTCGRRYLHKRGLTQHQRYECGKEAQFACQLCPFRSKLRGNLKNHILAQHASQV
ncbi:hypothetical protein J6590_014812 [Homalodisca vitripennis]|nr:hypothetical protein J6590_014812 [Homalodisca vitripennis]